MNEKTIGKQADCYSAGIIPATTRGDYARDQLAQAFEDGAAWRINSAWHDARREGPTYWKLIIRQDIMDDYDLGYELQRDTVRWAYVRDLIPDGKEDR